MRAHIYCRSRCEVVPALELIESVEELRKALKDPAELLQKLDEGVGPEAKRFVIAKLRPKLAEMLREHPGVQWEEASLRISISLDRGIRYGCPQHSLVATY